MATKELAIPLDRGGYRLAEGDDWYVEVHRMLYNWRLVVGLAELDGVSYEKGYCYFGTDQATLAKAILAARAWEDPLDTDPVGFDKRAY